jgi:hypothetical protein
MEEERSALISRGFVINERAELGAGSTRPSYPALLSPTFYDSYFGKRLSEVSHLLRWESTSALERILESDGISIAANVAPYFELNHALSTKGYTTVKIGTLVFPQEPFDINYTGDDEYTLRKSNNGNSRINILLDEVGDLLQLLMKTTPLSVFEESINGFITDINRRSWLPIPWHEDVLDRLTENTLAIDMEKWIYRRVYDSFSIPSPKYVNIVNFVVHEPYDRIYETGKLENPSPDNPYNLELLYLPQYKYGMEVTIRTIDLILEHNPNAVIVLQGDHGPHALGLRFLHEQGYSDDQLIEMNHSVISAVRIPPQYGGLDEPLRPVNISRVLVNRFVGENYAFLPDPAR